MVKGWILNWRLCLDWCEIGTLLELKAAALLWGCQIGYVCFFVIIAAGPWQLICYMSCSFGQPLVAVTGECSRTTLQLAIPMVIAWYLDSHDWMDYHATYTMFSVDDRSTLSLDVPSTSLFFLDEIRPLSFDCHFSISCLSRMISISHIKDDLPSVYSEKMMTHCSYYHHWSRARDDLHRIPGEGQSLSEALQEVRSKLSCSALLSRC